MTKFLIGVLVGFILAGITAVVAVFSLVRFGSEKKPVISDNSTLILRLEGDIPERSPVEFPLPFLEEQAPSTVKDVWDLLRKASVDGRIRAIVLEPKGLSVGWAKLQELRGELEQFRKTGKPLVAYLKSPGMREYFLATAADHVYMGPEDLLDVKGLRAELIFFHKTLDKLGVQVEIEHAGKYKDFGDMFTRDSMSAETREVMNSVLDDLYEPLLATLASGRRKQAGQIRAIIDDGPFLARQALDKGLVDGLLFEDQMFTELESRFRSGEIKKVSHRDYMKVPAASLGLEGKTRIALVVGQGDITRGGPGDDGNSDDGITAEGFNKLLRRAAGDKGIRGVVVRIDSPGGDAIASDEIWREMNLLSKKKPLVISMSDAAASGGYYISMTGDPVVAYPGTLTGSIGVVFGKATLHGLYDKLGVTKDFLIRGRFADIDSDYRPLTPEARQKLREGIDESYKDFVLKVAEARKRKFEEVAPLAEGRVWLGSQAKQRGLVDELGGLDRAIELLKQRAKIGKEEKVTIVQYPPKHSILDVIFGRVPEAAIDSRMPEPLRAILKSAHARVLVKGGLLRLAPYAIEVR